MFTKTWRFSENLRFACAREQHVILGMPVGINTRKACYIGYFDP